DALAGKRALPQLARYIARSMPEDAPGTLSSAEAEKVAAYIFDAFYSPEAQPRKKTPRVELARLTVGEYRNAVADLIDSFRSAKQGRPKDAAAEEFGLRGSYFKTSGRRNRALVFTRVDPVVRFDFGPSSPDYEKLNTPEFAVTWQGSVVALDTG